MFPFVSNTTNNININVNNEDCDVFTCHNFVYLTFIFIQRVCHHYMPIYCNFISRTFSYILLYVFILKIYAYVNKYLFHWYLHFYIISTNILSILASAFCFCFIVCTVYFKMLLFGVWYEKLQVLYEQNVTNAITTNHLCISDNRIFLYNKLPHQCLYFIAFVSFWYYFT